MTRLKSTADDDELLSGGQELSVHYKVSEGATFDGMLPLTGIDSTAELLNELAEFGCELQDDVILSVATMEAEFEDANGKIKPIGPRTPLAEIIKAGEVTVLSKAFAQQQQRSRSTRVINGGRTSGDGIGNADDDFESARKPAVAVKVAPRPVGMRPYD